MAQRANLWLIFLTIFLDMLGIGILAPVFPLLVSHSSPFRVTSLTWSEAESLSLAGWLLATYPCCQFLATPILGQFSDQYGRKRLLAIAVTGTAISYLIFGLGIIWHNLWLLFFSRIIDGVSGGNIAIAQAVIGDVSNESNRARNFGLTGVAIGAGFVMGPFIGGKFSDPSLCHWFNPATPFWLAASLSLINALIIAKYLPETLLKPRQVTIVWYRGLKNIYLAFTKRQLRQIIPILFLYNAGFTFFTTFWGVILLNKFGFNQSQVGDFFAYLGIMIILAQGGFVRRLSGRVRDFQVLKLSLPLTAGCLLVYAWLPAHATLGIYLVPPILAVATALTKAFSSALIARITPQNELGQAMGINASANALAQAIPAVVAGYLAASYVQLPVLVGAVIILVAGIIFNYCYQVKRP
jgi:DHA1 family tetracycline resistance protein-like MFS transporter